MENDETHKRAWGHKPGRTGNGKRLRAIIMRNHGHVTTAGERLALETQVETYMRTLKWSLPSSLGGKKSASPS